jgi:putative transposon-encoded protein
MPRKIKAIKGGKLILQENVEEIFERKIVPHGNGAKVNVQKKDIGKRAYVIILQD